MHATGLTKCNIFSYAYTILIAYSPLSLSLSLPFSLNCILASISMALPLPFSHCLYPASTGNGFCRVYLSLLQAELVEEYLFYPLQGITRATTSFACFTLCCLFCLVIVSKLLLGQQTTRAIALFFKFSVGWGFSRGVRKGEEGLGGGFPFSEFACRQIIRATAVIFQTIAMCYKYLCTYFFYIHIWAINIKTGSR